MRTQPREQAKHLQLPIILDCVIRCNNTFLCRKINLGPIYTMIFLSFQFYNNVLKVDIKSSIYLSAGCLSLSQEQNFLESVLLLLHHHNYSIPEHSITLNNTFRVTFLSCIHLTGQLQLRLLYIKVPTRHLVLSTDITTHIRLTNESFEGAMKEEKH